MARTYHSHDERVGVSVRSVVVSCSWDEARPFFIRTMYAPLQECCETFVDEPRLYFVFLLILSFTFLFCFFLCCVVLASVVQLLRALTLMSRAAIAVSEDNSKHWRDEVPSLQAIVFSCLALT